MGYYIIIGNVLILKLEKYSNLYFYWYTLHSIRSNNKIVINVKNNSLIQII